MDDGRITNCRNRVFINNLAFGANNSNRMSTVKTSVYRVTGLDQIEDIIETGFVRPKDSKLKGGHSNEVFWTQGNDKTFYYDGRPVIEASINKVEDGQIGAVYIGNLKSIWFFDEEQNKYIDKLNYVISLYNKKQTELNENHKTI